MADVDNPRFLRMQGHAQFVLKKALGERQCSFRLLAALTHDDKVIGPARQSEARRSCNGRRASGRYWTTRDWPPPPWGTPVRVGCQYHLESPPHATSPRPVGNTRPSLISSAIKSTSLAWSIVSKYERRSASTIQPSPAWSSCHTLRMASCGDRPLRYPKEHHRNSGSKIGSIRWTSACWTPDPKPPESPSFLTPPSDLSSRPASQDAVGMSRRGACDARGPDSTPCALKRRNRDVVDAGTAVVLLHSLPGQLQVLPTDTPCQSGSGPSSFLVLSLMLWFCVPQCPRDWGWVFHIRELSNLSSPYSLRCSHCPAQQSTGPSPSTRPFWVTLASLAHGRAPRVSAVPSFLSTMPCSDSWHRIGWNFARAYIHPYLLVASGRRLCSLLPALSSAGVTRFRPYLPLGRYQVSLGHPRLFPTVSPAHTLVRWGEPYAFASIVQARPFPIFGRPVHRWDSSH